MKVCLLMIVCLFLSLESGRSSDNKVLITLIEYDIFEKEDLNISIFIDRINNKEIDTNRRLQYLTIKEFKNRLGYYESKSNYKIVNKLGFKGKYQFSNYMIKRFAGVTPKQFLNNQIIQEKAMDSVCRHYIDYIIDHKYDRYINKKINGVTVTMEGLMLGLHFSPLWLKWWLQSKGTIDMKDSFPGYTGISIGNYIKRFQKDGIVKHKYKLKYSYFTLSGY